MKKYIFHSPNDDAVPVDRWMISYSDFITLLFVLFVALYAIAPREVREKLLNNAVQKAATQNSKRDTLAKLNSALAPLLETGEITTARTGQGVVVEIRDTALFTAGTADLNNRAQAILSKVGFILRYQPNTLHIEGHTDDRPIQTDAFPSNWELSAARASRVVRYLTERGFPPNRLRAVGLADTMPLYPNDAEETRGRNRRVTIMVMDQ